ncbi:MDIS1-interacting receptor like kinase 2-like [Prosopis cineraria]|uniref:MDIS1-interacting receptor like kinase 2-like n=1 Tax=Prosopis cineraria TaxID=364024 RepID=UPI00240F4570|nr:MDIS1-interacting receptor like kinase 2-like [Prosopis cineraria]
MADYLHILHLHFFAISSSFTAGGDEANALLKWKSTLEIQSQATLSSWNGTDPCKNWKGITCDESMSASTINLTRLGIQGILHSLNSSSFTKPRALDISQNKFSRIIPCQISNLSSIHTLNMSHNFLSGSIPREIGALTTLNMLSISWNNLTGKIPNEIGMLSNLVVLALQRNTFLNVRIPPATGKLTKLQYLSLFQNNFSGPIPFEFRNLHSLISLQMSNNNLHGPFLSSIGNVVKLEDLKLGNNTLSWPIPAAIGNLTRLKVLSLNMNKLNGTIPIEMNNLTDWKNLELTKNEFTGHSPQQVCLSRSLEHFTSCANKFTSPIPNTLKNCSSLIRLRLDNNILVGNITIDFGVYPHLKYIDLSGNKIYGHISSKWGKCHNLTSLRISNNNLSGSIPPELGEATNLGEFNVSSNQLTGEIPKELGKMISLTRLSLRNNQFSGKIPTEIESLNQLEQLELAANKFIGSIPKNLRGFYRLWLLNLSKNKFGGSIPIEFGRLHAITILSNLDDMSSLTIVDISYNHLVGPLPNNLAFQSITFEAVRNNIGLCALVLIAGGVSCIMIQKSKQTKSQDGEALNLLFFSIWFFDGRISHEKVIESTEDFNDKYLIGVGAQGSVYKVELLEAKFLKLDSNNITSFVGAFSPATPGKATFSIAKQLFFIIPYYAILMHGTESALTMQANEKCDVYSFEVLALEILIGRHSGELIYSLREISTMYNLPLKDVLDQRLRPPSNLVAEEVMLIVKITLACLNESPHCRPTMERVCLELEGPNHYSVNQFGNITLGQLKIV